jgi:hypothetical protein
MAAGAQPEAPPGENGALALAVDVTPFVLRSPDGPRRQLRIQIVEDGAPAPRDGRLSFDLVEFQEWLEVVAEEFLDGSLTFFVPEPETPALLRVRFQTGNGEALAWEGEVRPARPWTFYMTPHTHFDIGYTEPQPEVIKRLTAEMREAARFCRETADWPEESRYRWTVEVSALMRYFIERHSPEVVERFMELVREGRIEICGFCLNMPTELTGHEQLVRCLYYAETLRKRYDVPIDSIMINDVPGYAWALPGLLAQAGMTRASLRANSIRGQFLWDRPGAAPRPFYWEGPDGNRVFVWYTDSYREGNFFREPGLHEDKFLEIIRRNEVAGAGVDLIQLRMGGDNLPPDLDASRNARAWNERYVWPRVRVATNREYLEALEARYGADTPVHAGDIPSWWAEGPASSAAETGVVRLLHDEMTATEGLWATAWLAGRDVPYPHEPIGAAYEHMLLFDEHTWGVSGSVSDPDSEQTRVQWEWKRQQAVSARARADALRQGAIRTLTGYLPQANGLSVAAWNSLGWPRTDVVELNLTGAPLEETEALEAVHRVLGTATPVQRAANGAAWFIARDVPPLGYAVYDLRARDEPAAVTADAEDTVLENARYRVAFDPANGRWIQWFDKELDRELLDTDSGLAGNLPVHETPMGGRDAINRKEPVEFERRAAESGRLVETIRGPVFDEITVETALPWCPRILQRVRLYHALDRIEVTNSVEKDRRLDPEGVYFTFPFRVEDPRFRLQIACATMRPGVDQLPLTCQDFYSVQQWVDVAGDGYGVLLAPLEAPVVTLSDWNVYRWADTVEFDRGHVYSLAMNNYWYTNFKASQEGAASFRYNLWSYTGLQDPWQAVQHAWQPFQPLVPIWLPREANDRVPWLPPSWLSVEGGPLVVLAVKVAETEPALVVRLWEPRGEDAEATLTFRLPGGKTVARVREAGVVEQPGGALPVENDTVRVRVPAGAVRTLLITPALI